MPRIVDAAARRQQIVTVAARLIAEGGFAKLTLANLAKELGGSMRLVTHYFADRPELIGALLESGLRETDAIIAALREIDDDESRLHYALEWFIPDDEESLQLERVRVALAPYQRSDPIVAEFFDRIDIAVRSVLRAALPADLTEERAALAVDLLRVWVTGVAVAPVEHEDTWSVSRQRAVTAEFARQFSAGHISTTS